MSGLWPGRRLNERQIIKNANYAANVALWVCADDGRLRAKHQIRVLSQTIDFDPRPCENV